MLRLRKAGVKVTCCVDTVAASGGYMMACCADHLVASPFAFVGSIGVVSGMPNFYRVMQKNEIDYMMFTAGKYKRTVHPLTETTPEQKEKFVEQLEDIHTAFQQHVHENRNKVDMEQAGTGEAWIASQAVAKGLVDELGTSDEYIRSKFHGKCGVCTASIVATPCGLRACSPPHIHHPPPPSTSARHAGLRVCHPPP